MFVSDIYKFGRIVSISCDPPARHNIRRHENNGLVSAMC